MANSTPTGERDRACRRRLEDAERERLRRETRALDLRGGGAIRPNGPRARPGAWPTSNARLAVPVQAARVLEKRVEGSRRALAGLPEADSRSVSCVQSSRSTSSAPSSTTRISTTGWFSSSRERRPSGRSRRALPGRGSRCLTPTRSTRDRLAARPRVDLASGGYLNDRLCRGADGDRRQPVVHRARQGRAPRGHDHEDQAWRRPRRSSTSFACATSAGSSFIDRFTHGRARNRDAG